MTGAAVLRVLTAGPLVTVQDIGRPGHLCHGVPASGPMDRLAFRAANAALGNPLDAAGVEVSLGGLTLACLEGDTAVALAGGGFVIDCAGQRLGGWRVLHLRAGQQLQVRRGPWGSWCYLAFPGGLTVRRWLDSAATHALSGLGGGLVREGTELAVASARRGMTPGPIPCPVQARPRHRLRVTLGPQDRFFAPETLASLLSETFALTDAYDRMGVRLRGPPLPLAMPPTMPSEPILRGSVQVSADGVATVLLADHQTTGGYPKIATVLDADLDGFAQLRSHALIGFSEVGPADAIHIARQQAEATRRYLVRVSALFRGSQP